MSAEPSDRLRSIFDAHNELDQDTCAELVSLYSRKLWHELSLRLRTVFKAPEYQPYLHEIFEGFIASFGHKLNLLYFAQFAHIVAKQMDQDAATALLEKQIGGLRELKGHATREPVLYLEMSMAEHYIDAVHLSECKARLEKGLQELDSMHNVDPVVSAAVYNVRALFAKARQDFSGYYQAALQYLCYVSLDEVPAEEQLALARDISLAALLGDKTYSFAELLLHPVVKALDGTSYAWLSELLHSFSAGDMAKYEELCVTYGAQMNAQPALVAAEHQLRQKITIILPPGERKIPLATIAARTKLDIDGSEFLLMRAMSLGLIQGKIDELEAVVEVTHVQPRVLTMSEIAVLKGNLGKWMDKVHSASELLSSEGISTIETFA